MYKDPEAPLSNLPARNRTSTARYLRYETVDTEGKFLLNISHYAGVLSWISAPYNKRKEFEELLKMFGAHLAWWEERGDYKLKELSSRFWLYTEVFMRGKSEVYVWIWKMHAFIMIFKFTINSSHFRKGMWPLKSWIQGRIHVGSWLPHLLVVWHCKNSLTSSNLCHQL